MTTSSTPLEWLCRRIERCRGHDGATAAEYALLLATIAVVIVVAVAYFGSAIVSLFEAYPELISS